MDFETGSFWYVIHTHSGEDKKAVDALSSQGIITYAPRYQERRPKGVGRTKLVDKYFFPRYVFCFTDLSESFHSIRYTRGVRELVSCGGMVCTVEPEIIQMLVARQNERGYIRMFGDLIEGGRVEITDGLYSGLTGVFQKSLKDNERVSILLDAVSVRWAIPIEREYVRAVA